MILRTRTYLEMKISIFTAHRSSLLGVLLVSPSDRLKMDVPSGMIAVLGGQGRARYSKDDRLYAMSSQNMFLLYHMPVKVCWNLRRGAQSCILTITA